MLAGAAGRNRKRVNIIWNTKNFLMRLRLRSSLTAADTNELLTCAEAKIVGFMRRHRKLEEGNFVTVAFKMN